MDVAIFIDTSLLIDVALGRRLSTRFIRRSSSESEEVSTNSCLTRMLRSRFRRNARFDRGQRASTGMYSFSEDEMSDDSFLHREELGGELER